MNKAVAALKEDPLGVARALAKGLSGKSGVDNLCTHPGVVSQLGPNREELLLLAVMRANFEGEYKTQDARIAELFREAGMPIEDGLSTDGLAMTL